MAHVKILLSLFVLLLVLGGCGTKRQYFEPETLSGKVSYDGNLPGDIVDSVRDGATLSNGQIITTKGLSTTVLPEGFVYLSENDGRYVAGSKSGELNIVDTNKKVLFAQKFNISIASATLKGDILALVLGTNELVLIDIKDGKEVLHLKQDNVFVKK